MNLYILVEGRRTEKKVYPAWLSHLLPDLKKQKSIEEVQCNDYYIFSGDGYPRIFNHIKNAIEDINASAKFNYLLIVVDADEETVQERIDAINDYLAETNTSLKRNTKLEIIIQNRTMETWFLGNTKVFKKNPQDKNLANYISHYNVKVNDPELMSIPVSDERTHSQFHHDYCKLMLKERNICYSKKNPKGVMEQRYLNDLIERIKQTGHLSSFSDFIDFCQRIESEMKI